MVNSTPSVCPTIPRRNGILTSSPGDFVTPSFSCPFPVKRVGTLGDGGKYVCGFHRVTQGRGENRECVVYSFGVSDESSFEAEILESTKNCQVYGYDFSVQHWGPQLRSNPAWNDRVHFKPYKLGGVDDSSSTPEVHTLGGLMKMNGVCSFQLTLTCRSFGRRSHFYRHPQNRHRRLGIRPSQYPP